MSHLQLGSWNTREEARKSWEYFPYNKCVYLAELPNGQLKGFHVFTEKYIRNDLWFHIRWTGTNAGEARNCCIEALIEAVIVDQPYCSTRHQVDRPVAAIDRDRSVFIQVPQFIELPEVVGAYSIRSVIRLKRVESAVDTGMKQSSFSAIRLIAFADREYDLHSGSFVSRDGLGKQIDQIPSKLVETGTQTIDEIADSKCDLFRRRLWFDSEDVVRSIKIIIFNHRVRIALNPVPELGFGRLEVKVSPSGFHVDVLN